MILHNTQILTIIFPLKWFDSEITFHTKYFILLYPIDAIFTLSYKPNTKHSESAILRKYLVWRIQNRLAKVTKNWNEIIYSEGDMLS